jgi:hypothetical protein
MTREIPPEFWKAFCDGLKEWYRGVVSIRWIQPGGDIRIVAEDMPLQTVIFLKRKNACDDTMTFETGLPNDRPQKFEIVEPFRVMLRQNDESGRYNELEILAETGKTEITFTPGIESGLVEELATQGRPLESTL